MSTVGMARAERTSLCDLLDEVGPEAPTLCGGWTTGLLAAHLLVRERRPDIGPGLVLGGVTARWTNRVTARTAERLPFEKLVKRLRSGPPKWLQRVDGPMNLIEFFVHHEDVRRAVHGWTPRNGTETLQDALWPYQQRRIRLQTRALRDLELAIARPDGVPFLVHSRREVIGGKSPAVLVTGEPGELALYFFGRRDHALVELTGDPDGVASVRSAPIGL
jgi:uncharacterized protein (TIGR03085 family)